MIKSCIMTALLEEPSPLQHPTLVLHIAYYSPLTFQATLSAEPRTAPIRVMKLKFENIKIPEREQRPMNLEPKWTQPLMRSRLIRLKNITKFNNIRTRPVWYTCFFLFIINLCPSTPPCVNISTGKPSLSPVFNPVQNKSKVAHREEVNLATFITTPDMKLQTSGLNMSYKCSAKFCGVPAGVSAYV